MSKIFGMIMHALLGRRMLARMTEKVEEGGCAEFDVVLKGGTEYFVKSRVLNGRGAPRLSLLDDRGSGVFVYGGGEGQYFSVIPERDGKYRIRAEAGSGAAGWRPATVVVSLSTYSMPGYAKLNIEASSSDPSEASSEEAVPKGLPGLIA